MTTATSDSEEAGVIGTASDDSGKSGLESPSSSTQAAGGGGGATGTTQQQQISGHHDPKQRRIYVGLLIFSCLSALTGFLLIITWMFKFRSGGVGVGDADQLSNLHPIMMYLFMVSLNMYAVLVYRTHYNQAKDRLKWIHAILSGVNIVMSLLGVLAMFKSHQMTGRGNFYSLHSWIGVLTNSFYLTQFIMGFVSFLKPGLSQYQRASLMPWHRLIGAIILVLAATSAITGIAELVIFQDKNGAYSSFAPITFIANFAGLSVILMTGLSIYLLTASQYLRPRLPEEEPLKK